MRFRLLTHLWLTCVGLLLFSLFAAFPTVARIIGDDTQHEAQSAPNPTPPPTAPYTIAATLTSAPLMFVENMGQFGAEASYQIQRGNHTVWLSQDALWITVLEPTSQGAGDEFSSLRNGETLTTDAHSNGVNIRLQFVGANPTPRLEPFNRLETIVSDFRGNTPEKRYSNVPVWEGVRYVDLYPGIDLELSGEDGQFQPRLVVRNSASLHQVELFVEGAEQINLLATEGVEHSIQLTTAVGHIILPLLEISHLDGTVFEQSFNPSLVDNHITTPFAPFGGVVQTQQANGNGNSLIYSTYLGGSYPPFYDSATAIAVDAAGNAYILGYTEAFDFPTTPGAFDTSHNGPEKSTDAYIAKLNANGSALVYSTYLGGSSQEETYGIAGIAVDAAGNAYVTGLTSSTDFPTTPDAFDTIYNGGPVDGFVTKLNTSGSALLYSTFLGGGGSSFESVGGIAVDAEGNAYITGSTDSTDFPTTPGAFDTSHNGPVQYYDAFITKLNAQGSALLYSSFLGGAVGSERGKGIAVDAEGNAYITGSTGSLDFPITPKAYDTSHNGESDIFVVKFNATGNALLYSSFLGGGEVDIGGGIVVDAEGDAYITGYTSSTDFPTTPDAFDTSYNGGYYDGFVTKFDLNSSTLFYSTFLGGLDQDQVAAIVADTKGNAYITGYTDSINFPTTPGAFDTSHSSGWRDVFVTKLNPNGSALLNSTFLGSGHGSGIVVDVEDNAYVTGGTGSPDFPTTLGAFDTSYNGG